MYLFLCLTQHSFHSNYFHTNQFDFPDQFRVDIYLIAVKPFSNFVCRNQSVKSSPSFESKVVCKKLPTTLLFEDTTKTMKCARVCVYWWVGGGPTRGARLEQRW